jgi:hypothetical protein
LLNYFCPLFQYLFIFISVLSPNWSISSQGNFNLFWNYDISQVKTVTKAIIRKFCYFRRNIQIIKIGTNAKNRTHRKKLLILEWAIFCKFEQLEKQESGSVRTFFGISMSWRLLQPAKHPLPKEDIDSEIVSLCNFIQREKHSIWKNSDFWFNVNLVKIFSSIKAILAKRNDWFWNGLCN